MAKFTSRKVSQNGDTAALPAARKPQPRQGWRGEIVRRLAYVPDSLYGWVSGPAMTDMERERTTLAEARNSRSRGTLII